MRDSHRSLYSLFLLHSYLYYLLSHHTTLSQHGSGKENICLQTMKDLSFFLLKNSFGAKMRRGFKNFCNGDGSTSTLNQQSSDTHCRFAPDLSSDVAGRRSQVESEMDSHQPTLEEMLFQLDMEEKMARRAKLDNRVSGEDIIRHRMSCVNSSDILRTARNALNQYPRFSLDGKDAMYRSSFCNRDVIHDFGTESSRYLPSKIGGERVIWCKPGVVAKLMGLDAMPVPLRPKRERRMNGSDMMIRRQNLRRRAEMERHERRDTGLMMNRRSSCSKGGYCVLKPVVKEMVEDEDNEDEVGWPIRGGFLYSNRNLV